MMKIEKLGAKAGATLAIIALIGVLMGFADSRYASATDVADIKQSVLEGRIEDLEDSLLNIEFQIIMLSAKDALSEAERVLLTALELRRERLIRDVERLRGSDGI